MVCSLQWISWSGKAYGGQRRSAPVEASHGRRLGREQPRYGQTPQAVFLAYTGVRVRRRKCLRRKNLWRRLRDAVPERWGTNDRESARSIVARHCHQTACANRLSLFRSVPPAKRSHGIAPAPLPKRARGEVGLTPTTTMGTWCPTWCPPGLNSHRLSPHRRAILLAFHWALVEKCRSSQILWDERLAAKA